MGKRTCEAEEGFRSSLNFPSSLKHPSPLMTVVICIIRTEMVTCVRPWNNDGDVVSPETIQLRASWAEDPCRRQFFPVLSFFVIVEELVLELASGPARNSADRLEVRRDRVVGRGVVVGGCDGRR